MLLCLFVSFLGSHALAKTVTYNWEVGWVTACPDGFCRPVIGINGAWPCPTVDADLGDTMVLNVKNRLGNETTSIHGHGKVDNRPTGYYSWVDLSQVSFKKVQMRWMELRW
jgi:iron transport multicopper oxidase